MPMNVTGAFLSTALDALKKNTYKLTDEQKEELCDKLIELCKIYAPGTFTAASDQDISYSNELTEM